MPVKFRKNRGVGPPGRKRPYNYAIEASKARRRRDGLDTMILELDRGWKL